MSYKFAKSPQGRVLIVSPYLDHLGGGERYILTVASVLESLGHDITFAWDNENQINDLTSMLGISLTKFRLAPGIKKLYFSRNPIAMFFATQKFDIVVYLSDGSLPMLGSRNNIVHMQVPFHHVGGRSLKNQFKKRFVDSVIVNSHFTKSIVDREFGIRSRVVYPPVFVSPVEADKSNTILSVGRFEPSLNAKKQNILIEAFAKLESSLPGWRLVLAGASSSDDWVNKLRVQATGLPVEFAVNISYKDLSRLYATSRIYWHAAGYGIDETKNPELVEHFGITTVEAIGYGCIPLVVPFGGQREIVTDDAYHWTTIDELVDKTVKLTSVMPQISFDISSYNIANFTESISALL